MVVEVSNDPLIVKNKLSNLDKTKLRLMLRQMLKLTQNRLI